jgi:hypothetical protein
MCSHMTTCGYLSTVIRPTLGGDSNKHRMLSTAQEMGASRARIESSREMRFSAFPERLRAFHEENSDPGEKPRERILKEQI